MVCLGVERGRGWDETKEKTAEENAQECALLRELVFSGPDLCTRETTGGQRIIFCAMEY